MRKHIAILGKISFLHTYVHSQIKEVVRAVSSCWYELVITEDY